MSPVTRRIAPPGVTITGTGMAVPSKVVTNADLEKIVDTSDQWITQRTGIKQRHHCGEGETAGTLATDAVRQALGSAGIEPGDLDMLICATMTPDMICPGTGCQVVANLGAVPCGAMDLNLACTGFVAGLNIAAGFVTSGQYQHVAVVGAERLSGIVDPNDRSTCILFGDGAGAAIVSATTDEQQACLFQRMHSDGTRGMELYCPRGESDIPDGGVYNGVLNTLQMNGREVFKFAVTTLADAITEALDACELSIDDIKLVVPHQSNVRIISAAAHRIDLPEDKIYVNLPRYGNTSAASVGICLHEVMESGALCPGDIAVFVGLGGGLSWASSVWQL